jgi:hypothetical protein
MTTLKFQIQDLALQFANDIFEAIRHSSLNELAAVAKPDAPRVATTKEPTASETPARASRKGRLTRRSEEDVGKVVDQIVSLLKSAPKGMRAEEIRAALSLQAKELPRPLKEALKSKRATKSGQKRATTYFAGSAKAAMSKTSTPKAAKKNKKPVAKAKATKKTPKKAPKKQQKQQATSATTNGIAAAETGA